MRAINLIPPDQRAGAGGAAGKSGGAVYLLLGALGVFVVLAALYALAGKDVADKKADLSRLEADAAVTEARSTQYASFKQFSEMARTRRETVTSLAKNRFDWAHAVDELGRTIPTTVFLTSIQGTVSPQVTVEGGQEANELRKQIASPAVEMIGCADSQVSVARMMTRMRDIDAVTRVALQSSTKLKKGDEGSSGGGQSGQGGENVDCRYGSLRRPKFNLVVFFDQGTGSVPVTVKPQTTPVGASGPTGATGATTSATAVPTSLQEIK